MVQPLHTVVQQCFLVQSGKDDSEYETKHRIMGDFKKVAQLYNELPSGSGYKKRVLMSGKVLAERLD